MFSMSSYWPLFGLALRTPRLLLRPPSDEDFPDLLDAIDAGIHDPEEMPFSYPWTDGEPRTRTRGAVQYWWRARASWDAQDWHLPFAVFQDGRAIGIQELFARQFPLLREVQTGSWLTRGAQGQGFGKEMRAAILQLAFENLGAVVARSGAFVDNRASAAVSRGLGYRENGRSREAPRGTPNVMVNFELTRDEWLERCDLLPRAEVVGLDACLATFGITSDDEPA
jgi:RimJ/RimL family protein N-acetyltransferase